MASTHPGYPFQPRSTSYLQPGDFWAVPLSDSRFACGRVLATKATLGEDERMNRPGESGDSVPWEGWSHVREHVQALPRGVA
ncbi:Imm26 family immunity protein [Kineococcus xinjiangensis]|uniref:Imm26 family immunity protein n=1 Tax=Kineococcus xinjiangensis TaxID=512762 RepID=UPI000CECBD59